MNFPTISQDKHTNRSISMNSDKYLMFPQFAVSIKCCECYCIKLDSSNDIALLFEVVNPPLLNTNSEYESIVNWIISIIIIILFWITWELKIKSFNYYYYEYFIYHEYLILNIRIWFTIHNSLRAGSQCYKPKFKVKYIKFIRTAKVNINYIELMHQVWKKCAAASVKTLNRNQNL